jgi:uncharacterized membrane protein (UPF0182 family)
LSGGSSGSSRSSGGNQVNQPSGPPQAVLATKARQHYERAMQAQREGNWALYGEEIRLLGETLQELSK